MVVWVAGDVGLSNTQIMRELLLVDPRVVLVVQVRDPRDYARSVTNLQGGRQPLWMTHLFQCRGTSAEKYPTKKARLKRYMQVVTKEAAKLL